MIEDVVDNYIKLVAEVKSLASSCGRDSREIKIIAVSKKHQWEEVRGAYEVGCRDFGENRVQEAEGKRVQAPTDVDWHLIGTVQRNKVRKILHHYHLIHSVDSIELADKISTCSVEEGLITPILLQVNTSGELTKHGLTASEWYAHFNHVTALPGIDVQGFMTMAPMSDEEGVIRACFRSLRMFKDRWNERLGIEKSNHLSMGMSHDYRIAIEEGATLLRIGTLLFG